MSELKLFLGEKEFYKWKHVKFDDAFEAYNPKDIEEMNAFYKQDQTYLHRQVKYMPTFIMARKFIIKYILKKWRGEDKFKILDYGCGAGNLILPLAQMGFEVGGVEVKDSVMSKFLKHRFERRDLKLHYFGHEDDIGTGWDVIACWDVLEHVDYPRNALEKILQGLKKGGLLFLEYGWHERIAYPPLYETEENDNFIKYWLHNNFDYNEKDKYYTKK